MESFLSICKENYFNGITPSNEFSYKTEGYQKLVRIAKEYFNENSYSDFASYLMEGQYLVSLWAAHLLIEFGSPSVELKSVALGTITDYSNGILAKDEGNLPKNLQSRK